MPLNTPHSPHNLALAESLASDVAASLGSRPRILIAVVGEPGSGKSTVVSQVAAALERDGIATAIVPMDGFHLSNRVLDALGRRNRKGAIDTFDADGFVSLVGRIAAGEPRTIYAPDYDHGFGEPVAGSIAIEPEARVVLTEGNYLLDPSEPWLAIRDLADETWYVDIDDSVRRERLTRRHIEAGKAPEAAAAWVEQVDEKNAARIRESRAYADRVIRRS